MIIEIHQYINSEKVGCGVDHFNARCQKGSAGFASGEGGEVENGIYLKT